MQLHGEGHDDGACHLDEGHPLAHKFLAAGSTNPAKEDGECNPPRFEGRVLSEYRDTRRRESPIKINDWSSRSVRHLCGKGPTLLSTPGILMEKALDVPQRKSHKAHGIQPPVSPSGMSQDSRIAEIIGATASHYNVSACLAWAVTPSGPRMGACQGVPTTALPCEQMQTRPDADFKLFHHHVDRELPIIIDDLSADSRTANHPLVAGPPQLRFYAAAPLILETGRFVGTLTIADTAPRELLLNDCGFLAEQARLLVGILQESEDATAVSPLSSMPVGETEMQVKAVCLF